MAYRACKCASIFSLMSHIIMQSISIKSSWAWDVAKNYSTPLKNTKCWKMENAWICTTIVFLSINQYEYTPAGPHHLTHPMMTNPGVPPGKFPCMLPSHLKYLMAGSFVIKHDAIGRAVYASAVKTFVTVTHIWYRELWGDEESWQWWDQQWKVQQLLAWHKQWHSS